MKSHSFLQMFELYNTWTVVIDFDVSGNWNAPNYNRFYSGYLQNFEGIGCGESIWKVSQ